jgi:large subunit ribosomal protein L13
MRVIDASGCVLGRLASEVAEAALDGETVRVVNAERAVVTGNRTNVLDRYRAKREAGTQRKGPHFPRTPDRLVKRTVRGMIPFQEPRGRNAYRRLRCYIGHPEDVDDETEVLEGTRPRSVSPHVTIEEISRWLGAKV